jgi:folate-binding protein YgfZ
MTGHSVEEQVAWANTAALVVNAKERCVLEVRGADRLSWLNGLLTCELAKRKPGDAVYGLAVAQKGKIVSDVVVLVGDARVLLVVQRATVDALVASFDHHLMMEDAELVRSPATVAFAHGPKSKDVLAAVVGEGVTGASFDVTGLGGAVLVNEGADDGAIERAAALAGGGAGDENGWEAIRVRAAVPRFGVDFDDQTYPQEAALETKAVSFEKGCYLGQEVVCMLEMRGHVKRKLVPLLLSGSNLPSSHAPVDDGKGTVIGEVTSAARTPDGELRALAMLKYAFIASGTEVAIAGASARVV